MMKANMLRCLYGLLVIAVTLTSAGCGPDFYLSESEAAIYAGLMSREQDANNFISHSFPGQMLDLQFDNSSQPPTLRSTNLLPLMRNYTTLGLSESGGHVQLDRLNAELQKQVENWIRNELQLYMGNNNAGVRLSQLSSVQVHFLNRPTFTFHPDRQAIAFNLSIRLNINGTIDVNVLDAITDLLFDINGTYPLTVDINNFNLSGEAILRQPFADAAEITFNLSPQPGTISVFGAPSEVCSGARELIRQQLSQPLAQSFTQRYDYFSLVGLRLTPETKDTPSTLQHTYRARPEVAKPMMHFVTRATDGKLYHLRKTEGGPGVISTVTPFPNLPARVENEPALFASAADQLELAATTAANELVYAHWRNEAWGDLATFPATGTSSGYTGKPALVASQPGQVEIVTRGRDGGLWHLRRWNGKWLNPAIVPLSAYSNIASPPFRDPVAVHSSNKIVVAFADSQNRLRLMVFDLEAGVWGTLCLPPTQESITSAPAIVASGDGRIDVVYSGASGTPYHRVLTVQTARFVPNGFQNGLTLVGNETVIGGRLTATPVLVNSAYRQLELLGRGTDNKVYLNHFVGPNSFTGSIDGRVIAQGWQGWGALNDNFPGSLTFGITGFSAAASRTGKVAVAALRQPWLGDSANDQFLYHNSYDAERFGSQPWKTVQWRGYDQVGQRRFIGQPALALTDRNIALGYVSNAWTLQGARLTESNAAAFATYSTTQILSAAAAVDPVMVSSVAGEIDIVLIGTNGRMRHVRRSSRGSTTSSFNFPAPFEQSQRVQPAVIGYGNGQLEIVAVAQNNRLYHWRYLNGSWTAATQLSGTVISMPILVNLGSGQLLVMAVGGDQGLYYWTFINGSWSTHRQIVTGFPVNSILFGPIAASSWGDGSVDLALVNNQTFAVHHGRIGPGYFVPGTQFGLTPSRAFTSAGGVVSDTPILTAINSTRLNVLAAGTDHSLYSNWSAIDPAASTVPGQAPPIIWGGYRFIGGTNFITGGVARTGGNELTAVGTDRDGRVMVSRYNGVGWLQFQPVVGPPANTLLSPPFYRPAIAALSN